MKATKIEVAYDWPRRAWVVRPFVRLKVLSGRLRRRTFAVYPSSLPLDDYGYTAREQAIATGRKLGRAFAANPSRRPCELFIRRLDGTIGERETYGRDPERSKG